MHAGLTYPDQASCFVPSPRGFCPCCGSTCRRRVRCVACTAGPPPTRGAATAYTAPVTASSRTGHRRGNHLADTACRRGWRRMHCATRALDQRREQQPAGSVLHDSTEKRRRRRRSAAEPGGDVRLMLRLTLREAALGTQRQVIVRALRRCTGCDGVGARPGSHVTGCAVCRGEGQVARFASGSLDAVQGVCPECGGSGAHVEEFCDMCGGDGRSPQDARLTVSVPAGLDETDALRLRGQGHSGRFGGASGDVYLSFMLTEDPSIRREGQELVSTLQLPYLKAILGGTVRVVTLDGDTDLHVPAGTQHGSTLVLQNAGVPKRLANGAKGVRGSHRFEVRVQVPDMLSEDERRILEQLSQLT